MFIAFRQFLGRLSQSSFALAVLFFALLNLSMQATYKNWHPSRFDSPNRSWAWWAVNDLQKQERTPDIVLMGSSLMLSVVHDGDATYLNRSQDAVYHHRCHYLEHRLSERSQSNPKTFSLAIGGQMASDAYALVSSLFDNRNKPKVIVYGIAPRDFMDSMFMDPASTETFKFMLRAGNPELASSAGHVSFWNEADCRLKQALFMYGKRQDLMEIEQNGAKKVLAGMLGIESLDQIKTPDQLRAIVRFICPEDNAPNEWFANPYNPLTMPFRNNLAEYRLRYSLFKPQVFQAQLGYLERLMKFCQEDGIKLVLVNMPITAENLKIIPPGLYNLYWSKISNLARKYDAQLDNYNQPGLFPHSEFADSVHVNGLGARRFIDLLSDDLLKESRLAQISRKPAI